MKPRRRWFRYSLRTFFVLLTLFGVWLGVQVKWKNDRKAALDSMEWFFNFGRGAEIPAQQKEEFLGFEHINSKPKKDLPWTLRLLGSPPIAQIILTRETSPQRAAELKALFPEAEIIPR